MDVNELTTLAEGAEFSPVSWLNGVLSSSATSSSSLDSALSSLLVRLQLLGAEKSDHVETNMGRIVTALPRLRRDMRTIGMELPAILESLAELGGGIEGTASEPTPGVVGVLTPITLGQSGEEGGTAGASHYLTQLSRLDAAQLRLEAVAAQLGTAVAWDRLVRETEGVFERVGGGAQPSTSSAHLARMAEHIATLERTAAALTHMPEAAERSAFLAAANAELDRTLAPLLESALSTAASSPRPMQVLVKAFERLERPNRLADAAAAHRVAPLTAVWMGFAALMRGLGESGDMDEDPASYLPPWLHVSRESGEFLQVS